MWSDRCDVHIDKDILKGTFHCCHGYCMKPFLSFCPYYSSITDQNCSSQYNFSDLFMTLKWVTENDVSGCVWHSGLEFDTCLWKSHGAVQKNIHRRNEGHSFHSVQVSLVFLMNDMIWLNICQTNKIPKCHARSSRDICPCLANVTFTIQNWTLWYFMCSINYQSFHLHTRTSSLICLVCNLPTMPHCDRQLPVSVTLPGPVALMTALILNRDGFNPMSQSWFWAGPGLAPVAQIRVRDLCYLWRIIYLLGCDLKIITTGKNLYLKSSVSPLIQLLKGSVLDFKRKTASLQVKGCLTRNFFLIFFLLN